MGILNQLTGPSCKTVRFDRNDSQQIENTNFVINGHDIR